MNLLVLCPHFAPDVAPTGDLGHDLAGRGVVGSEVRAQDEEVHVRRFSPIDAAAR